MNVFLTSGGIGSSKAPRSRVCECVCSHRTTYFTDAVVQFVRLTPLEMQHLVVKELPHTNNHLTGHLCTHANHIFPHTIWTQICDTLGATGCNAKIMQVCFFFLHPLFLMHLSRISLYYIVLTDSMQWTFALLGLQNFFSWSFTWKSRVSTWHLMSLEGETDDRCSWSDQVRPWRDLDDWSLSLLFARRFFRLPDVLRLPDPIQVQPESGRKKRPCCSVPETDADN